MNFVELDVLFSHVWPHCTCKLFDCHGNSKAFVGSSTLPSSPLLSPVSVYGALTGKLATGNSHHVAQTVTTQSAHMRQSAGGSYLPHLAFCQDHDCVCAGVGCRAVGAATKNATCEIIVSLVGRRRWQIHTHKHAHTIHTYILIQ